jgi:HSP20 family protein
MTANKEMTNTQLHRVIPAADIEEHAEGYTLRIELPGVKREDMALSVNDGQLVLEAIPSLEPHEGLRYREFGPARFTRSFRLGNDIDPQRIDAALADGILTVRLARSESAKARQIEIG